MRSVCCMVRFLPHDDKYLPSEFGTSRVGGETALLSGPGVISRGHEWDASPGVVFAGSAEVRKSHFLFLHKSLEVASFSDAPTVAPRTSLMRVTFSALLRIFFFLLFFFFLVVFHKKKVHEKVPWMKRHCLVHTFLVSVLQLQQIQQK